MITAVDSSVLIDVLTDDPRFGAASTLALKEARALGRLIGSEILWAETSAGFESPDEASALFERLRIDFVPLGIDGALDAGMAWGRYRREGGSRSRLVADLLVAAHARIHADRLLTRDRGFFSRYFPDLALLDPSAS